MAIYLGLPAFARDPCEMEKSGTRAQSAFTAAKPVDPTIPGFGPVESG